MADSEHCTSGWRWTRRPTRTFGGLVPRTRCPGSPWEQRRVAPRRPLGVLVPLRPPIRPNPSASSGPRVLSCLELRPAQLARCTQARGPPDIMTLGDTARPRGAAGREPAIFSPAARASSGIQSTKLLAPQAAGRTVGHAGL